MGEEEVFEKAVTYVNGTMKDSGIRLSTEQKLQFYEMYFLVHLPIYSFYKQATIGTCNIPKPGLFDFEGKAKWESWKQLGDMQKEDAMKGYTEVLAKLVPNWNSDAEEETTDESTEKQNTTQQQQQQQQQQRASRPKSQGLGPVFSTLVYSGEEVPENQRDICYWASDGDLDKVKEKLTEGAKIDTRDGDYRTPLMWASDRGHLEVVDFLLSYGADVNLQDNEGFTPLHYAAMCEYEDIVKILLNHKADPTIKDNDGKTPKDVADENLDISVFDVK